MACTAKTMIEIAKKEVGYLEKKSNANLDSKTANAGSNNFTKYARDMNTWNIYNVQGDYWCDCFVDWLFVKAYGKAKAKELLGGFSAYTPTSAQYFKNKNQWYTKNPQVGDVIFFRNSERICHTGIVYKVAGSTVYTIEGNTSAGNTVIANGGGVAKKSYSTGNSRIAGYGRPKYDLVGKKPLLPVTPKSSKENIVWLQRHLNNKSDTKIAVDGCYGNATKKAVIVFKNIHKLDLNSDNRGERVGKKMITLLSK